MLSAMKLTNKGVEIIQISTWQRPLTLTFIVFAFVSADALVFEFKQCLGYAVGCTSLGPLEFPTDACKTRFTDTCHSLVQHTAHTAHSQHITLYPLLSSSPPSLLSSLLSSPLLFTLLSSFLLLFSLPLSSHFSSSISSSSRPSSLPSSLIPLSGFHPDNNPSE